MIERQQHKVSNLLSWGNVYKEFSFWGGGGLINPDPFTPLSDGRLTLVDGVTPMFLNIKFHILLYL
mgnify:CR=1 FL=1